MSQTELPIGSLPIWSRFNGVSFDGVELTQIEGKGFGLVTQRSFQPTHDGNGQVHTVLSVPGGLVLNTEAVEQYAKEDHRFRELLEAAGHQSARGDVLLFLLVQLLLIWKSEENPTLSNPWTQYLKYLPKSVPLPTLWTDGERLLLKGTSLEAALEAKMLALEREFDYLREKTSALPTWNEMLWENNSVHLRDWALLDAWYRSRCMELPHGGSSMVPCIDMVNHSANPNASYRQNREDGVNLCLRPDADLTAGEEITISYGDRKGPAEMLFSYGFVDPDGTGEKIILPLEVPEDDPLARAKAHLYGEAPIVRITTLESGDIQWESPLAYLLSLNEEDGLGIGVVQLTDGSRQMRLFWEDKDVTDSVRSLETVTKEHRHHVIFRLRAVVIVQERLQAQLRRITEADEWGDSGAEQNPSTVRPSCRDAASRLRVAETRMLRSAVDSLESEKSHLLGDQTAVAYLGSMEVSQSDLDNDAASNDEDDFS